MTSSIRQVWHVSLTGNVFSHQFQRGGVVATVVSPSTEKKSLGVAHSVAFLPCWVGWARGAGRARLGDIAGGIEEADVATCLCEVFAPRVSLAKSLALAWTCNLEVLRENLSLADLPREP